MILDLLLIIVGITVVIWGADKLTEGASALARRMNVPEMVIGLTIVAAGTSAPELFVSLMSALKGTPDLAVGNVVGSNIMNTLIIVGVTAMVAPMTIARQTVSKDIPFTIIASLLLMLVSLDRFQTLDIRGNVIARFDGVLLLLGFAAFMYYTFSVARKGTTEVEHAPKKDLGVWMGIAYVLGGLFMLIVGSDVFVNHASTLASTLGVSESIIGLTIVAGGTSMPELATSVVAARKGRSAMAIGNVIGSNVFNILLIIGLTAVVCPMQIGGITIIDMSMMVLSVVLLWIFSYTKLTVARWEGAVMTATYMIYLGWLLYNI
jgi:cation:H+ antiporter